MYEAAAVDSPLTFDAPQAHEHRYGPDHEDAGNIFDDITSVADDVQDAVRDVISSVADRITSPAVLGFIKTAVSFVPGFGTAAAAAISAGQALAKGEDISDILISAAKGAMPGGPIAAAAFDFGASTAAKLLKGERLDQAVLEAARKQLPAEGQLAFDTALAMVQGKGLQDAVAMAPKLFGGLFTPTGDEQTQAAQLVANAERLTGTLGGSAGQAAQALLRVPGLRSLGASALGQNLGVDPGAAKSAIASVMQTIDSIGLGKGVQALARNADLEGKLGDRSLDQAMADFSLLRARKLTGLGHVDLLGNRVLSLYAAGPKQGQKDAPAIFAQVQREFGNQPVGGAPITLARVQGYLPRILKLSQLPPMPGGALPGSGGSTGSGAPKKPFGSLGGAGSSGGAGTATTGGGGDSTTILLLAAAAAALFLFKG